MFVFTFLQIIGSCFDYKTLNYMFRKALKVLFILLFLLSIGYMVGPTVKFDTIQKPVASHWLSASLSDLDSLIAQKESKILNLKPDNEARIIWNDTAGVRTGISVVYLHGFSASQEEGDPIHTELAKRYGANLYLARLHDHGRADSMSFVNTTPQDLIDSANEAIDIGTRLGDTLIVVSCSTGGTLSAYLASIRDDIDALVMYSPNIDLYDKKSELLLRPWGKPIAKKVFGGNYVTISYDDNAIRYWNDAYHINGTFMVRDLLNQTMTKEVFEKIKIPVFLGYYFKDDEHSDHVVSVPDMIKFYNAISTPENFKRKVAYPDAERHVISSWVFSKSIQKVSQDTYDFLDATFRIK